MMLEDQIKSARAAISELYGFGDYKPGSDFANMVSFMRQFINEVYVHNKRQITNKEMIDLLNAAGIESWVIHKPSIVHEGRNYIKSDDLRKDYTSGN